MSSDAIIGYLVGSLIYPLAPLIAWIVSRIWKTESNVSYLAAVAVAALAVGIVFVVITGSTVWPLIGLIFAAVVWGFVGSLYNSWKTR